MYFFKDMRIINYAVFTVKLLHYYNDTENVIPT